ncbi:MAG: vWA domain-containing protein [Planctomycetota bacterium]|jgi:Mg-chelatase subunit ChlD
MRTKGQNLIVCIDASSSMNERFSSSTKIAGVNDGVETMLPNLCQQRGTMIGLVGFNSKPFVVKPLVFPNNRELIGRVKSIRVGGCTHLLGGIGLACKLLSKRPRCFSRRVMGMSIALCKWG